MSTTGTLVETGISKQEPQPKKGLLRNRNFVWLASGQAISNMGDFVYSTTLLIWVYALGGSAAAVSGVLVAEYAPVLALGALAGVFVDRWNRLRTMLASDLARAVIALLPILAPASLRLPTIYLSVFLISAIGRLFMPAQAGVRQVLLPERDQPQAAAFSQVTQALAIITGPGLASPLYFAIGPVIAVLINAASYAVSAFCIWRIRIPAADLKPARTRDASGQKQAGGVRGVLSDMRAGLAFVLYTRTLLVLVLLGVVGMFGAGAINALEIIFVHQRLHADPDVYGYLVAIGGIGSLLGALLAGILAKRVQSRHIAAGGMLGIGIGLAIYALQTQLGLAMLLTFLFSLPQGMLNVGIAPLLMSATPRHLMGRVQALFTTATFGASLLSIVLSGYLGSFVPAYLLLLAGSILIIVAGIFGLLALPAPETTPAPGKDEVI